MLKLKRVPKSTRFRKSKITPKGVVWVRALDIKKRIGKMASDLKVDWIKTSRIFCFRSKGAKTQARARIWGLSRVWQKALQTKPAYIIEVISEKFDHLPRREQDQILLHELAHIPKNFSGSLLPHIRHGKRSFNDRVEKLITQYLRKIKY